MTRAQAAAVRMVEEALPRELVELLPKKRPAIIRDAILAALDSRNASQLTERVARRWSSHNYAAAHYGGKGLSSPVGVVVGLVRPPKDCPNLGCEDGQMIDTGADCRTCAQRRAERRDDHRAGRTRRSEGPSQTWACSIPECPVSGGGPGHPSGLCPACRVEVKKAEEAGKALKAQWEADEREVRAACVAKARAALEWNRTLAAAYSEDDERGRPAEGRQKARVAEEMRARFQTAAQTSNLRDYAQAEAIAFPEAISSRQQLLSESPSSSDLVHSEREQVVSHDHRVARVVWRSVTALEQRPI
ncbi:hypothetical protein [Streptomyces sp. NPDC005533]|uniref:hypothetical protein n=1 Tax=Streptomyces sp. NPDC005533 TaxID=3364723 RepID=UPI0036C45218